jgi:hypothetical protein
VDELKLPEHLKGPWEHVLILTYGLDVPFFENALWNQFGSRCRNKIILADGQRYLESCAVYARGGLVRHLNQRYIAEGIFVPHAAHAKAIMLANPERGRLLIGSGNLGWQGYASGGELFTQYEYSADHPQALNAFLAVRELVDGLLACRYVSPSAARRIRHLWEQAPWLFQSPQDDWQPVRHNLDHSFLDQLQQLIGAEPVEELWVLTPFYDRRAVALERLLSVFKPDQATLLMQAGYTSVEPAALHDVLDRFGSRCRVRSFSKGTDSPYVHAKMLVLKLSNQAICLQGSPNLSQVAMLLPVPLGNIELANLLDGPRNAFDKLLDALDIQTTSVPLDALELQYQPPQTSLEEASDQWHLTGGEWYDDRLHLRFQGIAPDLGAASLIVASRSFPLSVWRRDSQALELRLSTDAISLLDRPVPVAIHWTDGNDSLTTNPVFVCNRAALDAALEITEDGKTLDRIGDLDLDDEEFERLLAELDAALVIDRRSIWTLAGRTVSSTTNDEEEAFRLDYIDVDYDMLRQHPKLQQYVSGRTGEQAYSRSRLQIILNSITDHFQGLLDTSSGAKAVDGALADLEDTQAETEDEREQEEEEKQKRRRSQAQRLRRILKNFMRRYLRGIRSPDFQELAGFEVMAQNYVIFSYILWRLFAKDWVEPEFVLNALLETWIFFWGHGSKSGLFEMLDEEDRAQVLQLVQGDQHADAVMLASLYYGAFVTRLEHWKECRLALRKFWRHILRHQPFEVSARVLENTWHIVAEPLPYEPPLPGAIVDELAQLAQFETQQTFLRALEERYGYPHGSCRFEKTRVYREPLEGADTVDCLVVRPNGALADKDAAVSLLQAWMRFQELEYYRICTADGNRLLFYEGLEQKGLYYAKDLGGKEIAVGQVEPEVAAWDVPVARLRALANQVEEELVLVVREPSVASLGEGVSWTKQ